MCNYTKEEISKLHDSCISNPEIPKSQIGLSLPRAVLMDAATIQQSSLFSAISAAIFSREKRPLATICSSQDLAGLSQFTVF
jgi:hypothetical protein